MSRPAVRVMRAELADLIDEYLDQVKTTSAPATHYQYSYVLRQCFMGWAAAEGISQLAQVDRSVLDRWSRYLQTEPGKKGKPYSPVTVQSYVTALNLWLGWLARHAGGDKDLRAGAPRPRRRTLVILTREDIEAMEKAAKYPRDQLIVRLLADTGIRVGELINLRVCDLVREQGRCYLHVRGKTGGRPVGIEPALHRRIRAYIEGGRGGGGGEEAPLFLELRRPAEPLTVRGIQQVIKYLAQAAGIRKRVYPHLFRHSYATAFLNTTHDPITLARVLGHGSLAMIQNVYAHLAAEPVHDAMLRHLQAARKR